MRLCPGILLERFSNTYVLSDSIEGGFYFHPSDEDLSLRAPVEEKATLRRGFGVQQLENRYSGNSVLTLSRT